MRICAKEMMQKGCQVEGNHGNEGTEPNGWQNSPWVVRWVGAWFLDHWELGTLAKIWERLPRWWQW